MCVATLQTHEVRRRLKQGSYRRSSPVDRNRLLTNHGTARANIQTHSARPMPSASIRLEGSEDNKQNCTRTLCNWEASAETILEFW